MVDCLELLGECDCLVHQHICISNHIHLGGAESGTGNLVMTMHCHCYADAVVCKTEYVTHVDKG